MLDKIPPPKPAPSAPKPPPIETGPEIEMLDVFKTVLEGDAGQDAQDTLDAFISHLSKAQMDEMDRRIRRLCRRLLKKSKDKSHIKETYSFFKEIIENHLEISEANRKALQAHIALKLEELGVADVEFSSKGGVRRVFIEGKWVTREKFIATYLSDELQQARELVQKGDLVRINKRHTGRYFISKAIEEAFTK